MFCQGRLFLQPTTGSKTERLLFNLEEQAVTEVSVVRVSIDIRIQTSKSNEDLPKAGTGSQELLCPGHPHECYLLLEDSAAARGLP